MAGKPFDKNSDDYYSCRICKEWSETEDEMKNKEFKVQSMKNVKFVKTPYTTN